MINELINNTNFNPIDPFDIKTEIFSKSLKTLLPLVHDKFLTDFYREWLVYIFSGEFDATISYPKILDKMKDGTYAEYLSGLSVEEHTQLCNYFEKIIKEENEHTSYFLSFIKRIYGESLDSISDSVLNATKIYCINKAENTNLIHLLIAYYIGECYFWTCFYKIYKETVDSDKRMIFKKVLVEEAQHNNNIYKLVKQIKNKITINSSGISLFVGMCQDKRYFGLDFVKQNFKFTDSNTKKDHYMLKLVYDCEWQRNFNTIVIKKWYQLFEVLYPSISIEQFTKMINKNDGEWSRLELPITE